MESEKWSNARYIRRRCTAPSTRESGCGEKRKEGHHSGGSGGTASSVRRATPEGCAGLEWREGKRVCAPHRRAATRQTAAGTWSLQCAERLRGGDAACQAELSSYTHIYEPLEALFHLSCFCLLCWNGRRSAGDRAGRRGGRVAVRVSHQRGSATHNTRKERGRGYAAVATATSSAAVEVGAASPPTACSPARTRSGCCSRSCAAGSHGPP